MIVAAGVADIDACIVKQYVPQARAQFDVAVSAVGNEMGVVFCAGAAGKLE